jgi:hypothetical protein
MPQSLINADLASTERREKLKRFSQLALHLAEWAAEGRSDYFIASQLSMLVRGFSQAVDPSGAYPDMPAVLDFLGMQIQSVVGKAHKSQEVLAQAVNPPHETELTVMEAK